MADDQGADPGTNATFHEATSTTHTVAATATSTARADTYTVQITARLNGGALVYDQTVAGRFGDPLVLDAVAAARAALAAAGGAGTKIDDPELTSSGTTLLGSASTDVDTVQSQQFTTQDRYVTTIGPATIRYGDLGLVAKVPETTGDFAALSTGTSFYVVPGGMDITHILNTDYSVLRTTTTTSTYQTAEVYELDGFANRTPAITSGKGEAAASYGLAENKAGVATLTATDADSGALTWSLTGKDAKLFLISKGGALSFKSAPDYEVPKDAGKNNTYDVTVNVTDGNASDTQALTIKITDVKGKVLTGSSKANTLLGTSEEDTLKGKGGNDTLKGLGGADTFVFDTKPDTNKNFDKITDFSSVDDTIQIDNKFFVGLKSGKLASSLFQDLSKGKADDKDRIIYDKKHGDLFFDQDGAKDGFERIKFAEVKDNTDLSHTDFLIV